MEEFGNLIGGKWEKSGSPRKILSPFDGTPVGTVCPADAAAMERTVQSAVAGFEKTRQLPAYERERILQNISSLIAERKDAFAKTIAGESGKPLKYATGEVERAVITFQVAAEETKRIYGEVIPSDVQHKGSNRFACTQRFPKGVVLGISPFNFPLNLVAHKIAPTLASGNSIILKPSSTTPLTALLLGEVVMEAGVPADAVNIITCPSSLAAQMVKDDRIAMISFTGSSEVGWKLKQTCGKKGVLLELGGNAAVILHQDADLELSVPRCVVGGYAYSGQVCISLQRIYVHKTICDDFLSRFIDAVKKLTMGDPLDEATDIGPVINVDAAERIESWTQEAVSQGAKLLAGGKRNGLMLEPTLLTNVTPAMKVCKEEVFGPVVVVIPYTDFDEALHEVNNSRYGLQAGVFTRDANLIFKAFKTIEVGGLLINDVPTFRLDHMPYGGVKDSGMGREGLRYSIQEMTEPRLLIINFPA